MTELECVQVFVGQPSNSQALLEKSGLLTGRLARHLCPVTHCFWLVECAVLFWLWVLLLSVLLTWSLRHTSYYACRVVACTR